MAQKKNGSGRVKLPPHKKLVQVSVWVLPVHKKTVKVKCQAIADQYR